MTWFATFDSASTFESRIYSSDAVERAWGEYITRWA